MFEFEQEQRMTCKKRANAGISLLWFQGRMLHLLPSTVKKEKVEPSDAGGPGSSSYKRQKDAKNKASSSR